jgi:hypothetical protein
MSTVPHEQTCDGRDKSAARVHQVAEKSFLVDAVGAAFSHLVPNLKDVADF